MFFGIEIVCCKKRRNFGSFRREIRNLRVFRFFCKLILKLKLFIIGLFIVIFFLEVLGDFVVGFEFNFRERGSVRFVGGFLFWKFGRLNCWKNWLKLNVFFVLRVLDKLNWLVFIKNFFSKRFCWSRFGLVVNWRVRRVSFREGKIILMVFLRRFFEVENCLFSFFIIGWRILEFIKSFLIKSG